MGAEVKVGAAKVAEAVVKHHNLTKLEKPKSKNSSKMGEFLIYTQFYTTYPQPHLKSAYISQLWKNLHVDKVLLICERT